MGVVFEVNPKSYDLRNVVVMRFFRDSAISVTFFVENCNAFNGYFCLSF